MSKNLNEISFLGLLPSSIAGDPTMEAAAQALESEIQYINDKTKEILIWSRIDEIGEPLLSALAYQLHVDYWDNDLPLETKREIIKTSIAWHRIKGTPAAVEKMLLLIIGGGVVEDWHEYGGDPFYFRIQTSESLGGPDIFDKLISTINRAKNTRSWLEKIIVTRKTIQTLNLSFAVIDKKTVGLGPAFWIKPIENRFIGVVPRIGTKTTINAI